MAKPSLRLILPVFAALGVACRSDVCCEPPHVFIALAVTPTDALLSAVAPGNTLQLRIQAYDQAGAPMGGADAATYSSSAAAIAAVSSSGVVTAAAPGTAVITAALTLGGITKTASTTVTVYAGDYASIAGLYDLTALITSFDPAWGEDLTGYRYTAVLTLQGTRGPPWVRGTYADFRLIGPAGDTTHIAGTGVVTGSIFRDCRLVLELAGPPFTMTLAVSSLAPGSINGTFGTGGHISGPFTATRRPLN